MAPPKIRERPRRSGTGWDLSMGQNLTTRIWTAVVFGSIYQGKPFWGYSIFDTAISEWLTWTCPSLEQWWGVPSEDGSVSFFRSWYPSFGGFKGHPKGTPLLVFWWVGGLKRDTHPLQINSLNCGNPGCGQKRNLEGAIGNAPWRIIGFFRGWLVQGSLPSSLQRASKTQKSLAVFH